MVFFDVISYIESFFDIQLNLCNLLFSWIMKEALQMTFLSSYLVEGLFSPPPLPLISLRLNRWPSLEPSQLLAKLAKSLTLIEIYGQWYKRGFSDFRDCLEVWFIERKSTTSTNNQRDFFWTPRVWLGSRGRKPRVSMEGVVLCIMLCMTTLNFKGYLWFLIN